MANPVKTALDKLEKKEPIKGVSFGMYPIEVESLKALLPNVSGSIYIQENPENNREFLPNKKIRVFNGPNWNDLKLKKQSVIFNKAPENYVVPESAKVLTNVIFNGFTSGTNIYLLMTSFGVYVMDTLEASSNLKNLDVRNILQNSFTEIMALNEEYDDPDVAKEIIKVVLGSFQEIFALGDINVSFVSWDDLPEKLNQLKITYYHTSELDML